MFFPANLRWARKSIWWEKSAAGDANANRLIKQADTVTKNTANAIKRRGELQNLVSNNEGIMQAAQTTNQYLDLIASQNTDLTTLLAENSRELAEKKKLESLSSEREIAAIAESKKKSEALKNSFGDRWGKKLSY